MPGRTTRRSVSSETRRLVGLPNQQCRQRFGQPAISSAMAILCDCNGGISRITQALRQVYYGLVKRIMREERQVIPCYAGWLSAHILQIDKKYAVAAAA